MGEQLPDGLDKKNEREATRLYAEHKKITNTLEQQQEYDDYRKRVYSAITTLRHDPLEFAEKSGREFNHDQITRLYDLTGKLNELLSEMIPYDIEQDGAKLRSEEKRDSNLWNVRQHYSKNEEAYKQQAVNEAREAGVDVNYPPYTDQQNGSETTPDQPQ